MKIPGALIFLIILTTNQVCHAQPSKFEASIGAQTLEIIKKTQGIYENPRLLSFVKDVGHALEKELRLGYELKYYLVDTAEPNAFAVAGGYVFVTRGLLAVVNTKDEMAGVMAHELTHVTEGHSTKKLKASILPTILELPANIIGLLTYKEAANIINLPITAASKIALASYSRSQEKEADEKGIDLAEKAGFNPFGLAEALERLTTYIEFSSGEPMKKTIFIDHPMTEDRVSDITKRLALKGIVRTKSAPGTSLLVLDGLIYGQNPNEGILDESKFLHRQMGLYCELPAKWNIQNSPVSLTAVAPDKKSTVIVSIDTSATTPANAAKESLKTLRNSSVIYQEETMINGLEGYRATIRNKQIKYADHVTELMWLKIPSSQAMLKVVGITDFNSPDKGIITSFNTFREITKADLTGISYATISLKEVIGEKTIDAFYSDSSDKTYKELVAILNGATASQSIQQGRYIKVVAEESLE